MFFDVSWQIAGMFDWNAVENPSLFHWDFMANADSAIN